MYILKLSAPAQALISQLTSVPAQLCVALVFLGLGLWLAFWTFRNNKDD
jgi:hypothetical protein